MEHKVGVFNISKIPLNEEKKELSDAYTRYKLVRKSAQQMRKDWMENIAARQANEYKGTAASRLITMLHHENQRCARKIITAVMRNKKNRRCDNIVIQVEPRHQGMDINFK